MKPAVAKQFRDRLRKRDIPYLAKKSMKKKVKTEIALDSRRHNCDFSFAVCRLSSCAKS